MKGPAIARCRQEGGTREDEGKDLQPVSALLLAESEQAAIMAGDGRAAFAIFSIRRRPGRIRSAFTPAGRCWLASSLRRPRREPVGHVLAAAWREILLTQALSPPEPG